METEKIANRCQKFLARLIHFQAGAARWLDLTEGAIKVAIHRLRKRFRELVKAEIAQTVPEPGQVQEELR